MIDSHQHFWMLDKGFYAWLTPDLSSLYRDFAPDDLAPLLRHGGVKRTIAVQAAPVPAETEFLLGLAKNHSFIGGVVGWTDLKAPASRTAVARAATLPRLVGLRPMPSDWLGPEGLSGRPFDQGLEAVAEAGLRLDALMPSGTLASLLPRLRASPDLTLVVDHAGNPDPAASWDADWANAARAAARHPRVHVKLSGLAQGVDPTRHRQRLRAVLDLLLDTFGPDRIMWGSDWPVANLATDYATWLNLCLEETATLSQADRSSIFGETAARFYGLSDTLS